MVLEGSFDTVSELALISISVHGQTGSVSGIARVISIAMELGDRRADTFPLLSGSYLTIMGNIQNCTLRLSFRPTAVVNLKEMVTEGVVDSLTDLWASVSFLQADINPYVGNTAIFAAKISQRFRVSVLLGPQEMLIDHASGGGLADGSISSVGWASRITFAECTLQSSAILFDPTLGLSQSLTLTIPTFDSNGESNILIEQKLETETLIALGDYVTTKWAYGTSNTIPGRL